MLNGSSNSCVLNYRPLIIQFGGYRKMKWEVKLYVGGTVLKEEVRAVNMQDAKTTALARNPTARIIGVNPIVGS